MSLLVPTHSDRCFIVPLIIYPAPHFSPWQRSFFLLESEAVGCAATPADVAVSTTAPRTNAATAAPATRSFRLEEVECLGLRSVAQSNIGIGRPKSINYYSGRPDHLLKNSARARYRPGVTTVTRATASYRAPRVSPAPGSPQRRAWGQRQPDTPIFPRSYPILTHFC